MSRAFETLREHPVLTSVALVGALALGPLTSGCATPSEDITQCVDTIPRGGIDASPVDTIGLELDDKTGEIKGKPAVSPEALGIMQANTVRIEAGDSSGTGFISGGKIITAAHVIHTLRKAGIRIIASDGRDVGVRSACYTYQEKGSQAKPPKATGEATAKLIDADIAILVPETSLGEGVPLADEPPRGSWLSYGGYSDRNKSGKAPFYSGIMSTPRKNELGSSLYGRLEQKIPNNGTIMPGNSGGPIFIVSGNSVKAIGALNRTVVADTTADLFNNYALDSNDAVTPQVELFTPTSIIRTAAASPKLN